MELTIMSTLPLATAAIRPPKSMLANFTSLPRAAAKRLASSTSKPSNWLSCTSVKGAPPGAHADHQYARRLRMIDLRHAHLALFDPAIHHVRVNAVLFDLRQEAIEVPSQILGILIEAGPHGIGKIGFSDESDRVIFTQNFTQRFFVVQRGVDFAGRHRQDNDRRPSRTEESSRSGMSWPRTCPARSRERHRSFCPSESAAETSLAWTPPAVAPSAATRRTSMTCELMK